MPHVFSKHTTDSPLTTAAKLIAFAKPRCLSRGVEAGASGTTNARSSFTKKPMEI